MPIFTYKAVTASGNADQGEIEAPDQAAAIERLQSMGFIPIRVEATTGTTIRSSSSIWLSRRRVSQQELGNLTRELGTLLRAGLSLDRSLEILQRLSGSTGLNQVISSVRDDVRGGSALSDALAKHPSVFGRFYVSMIKAGEAGGALGVVLTRISEFMERSKELKDTVTSALIYPIILLFVAITSVLLLLTFVVPQFTQMFEQSGKELPLATQIVVSAGDFLKKYWWTLLLGAISLRFMVVWWMKNPERRYHAHKRILGLPLIGDLNTKVEIARFSRTLGTLLNNGVSLLPALSIVKDIVGNNYIVSKLEIARDKLKEGQGLGKPLMEQNVFPELAVHMIMVGEETGALDAMLNRIADVYDREVQTTVKRLLALIEPVMILSLGLIVGGIIMSILLAILQVNSLVG